MAAIKFNSARPAASRGKKTVTLVDVTNTQINKQSLTVPHKFSASHAVEVRINSLPSGVSVIKAEIPERGKIDVWLYNISGGNTGAGDYTLSYIIY